MTLQRDGQQYVARRGPLRIRSEVCGIGGDTVIIVESHFTQSTRARRAT